MSRICIFPFKEGFTTMKTKLMLVLTLVLLVGVLSACGDKNTTTNTTGGTTPPAETTPVQEATPAPTNTPTVTPTPTPDPNAFFASDFDNYTYGLIIDDKAEDVSVAVKSDPTLAYLLFDQVGAGMADLAVGKGVDGSNCLVATARNASWNGIALAIDPKWFGKGFKISFDAKAVSEKEGVNDMLVSCTTKFEILNPDTGAHPMKYPAYNRATGHSIDGEWVHCEQTVFFPTDIYINPDTGVSQAQMFFECADGKGLEDVYIDNLTITVVDGVGDWAAFEAYWEEHKPAEEEEE